MDVPTLGIEEEFLLVDARTSAWREDAEGVRRRAAAAVDQGIEHELRTPMIETGSAVCRDLASAAAELHRRRLASVSAAAEVSARLLASASHPFAPPDQVGFTDERRYRRMAREFGPVAEQTLVCGCHVHVSVPDRASGVAVLDRIRPWLAMLVALSANSPMWLGHDTGYDSWRTQVWSRWPTAGPTSIFGDLATYEARAEALIATGAALDRGMLYYEARLSERWPTVEVRVADVCLDVDDAVLIGALVRALAMTALDHPDAPAPDIPVELLRAATFVASRSGLRGRLVDPTDFQARPAATVLDRLVAHVRGALEDAGDVDYVLECLARLRRDGTAADRQRRAFGRGGPRAVLDLVALG
jgi:carboxylate-amine ligase